MITLTPLRLVLLAASILGLVAVAYVAGRRASAPPGQTAALALVGADVALTDFGALPGWGDHDPSLAIAAFARSCERRRAAADAALANPYEALGTRGATLGGTVGDWRAPCAAAADFLSAPGDASAARGFFESQFRPLRLAARLTPGGDPAAPPSIEREGRFTAYFEPVYPASDRQMAEYSAPVLERPADLVTVDLGAFREELAGDRIAGSVIDGALSPYPDHAAINANALAGRAEVIAWMRPDDLLFLQIQGSGRLRIFDRDLRVGYDGHNGWKYTAIGKTLIEGGALTRETVSMQTIMAWLGAAPADEARRVRESNRSYIFFRRLDDLADPALGPPGADGAQLTPMVSLAVDPRFTPLGAPVYLDIDGEAPIRRLMIAQDRGGAIKGPVRGDLYAGSGEAAGEFAGVFNRMGTLTVLVPRSIAERLPPETTP